MKEIASFEIGQLQHVFEKLGEFFHAKVFFGFIFMFLSCALNGSYEIMITIFVLLTFDSITGTGLAIRNYFLNKKGLFKGEQKEIFSSRGLYRGPFKLCVYFIFILVSRLVDKHIMVPFASPMVDAFLVATEGYSILENFAKMGFAAPTGLISKLKDIATKKSE